MATTYAVQNVEIKTGKALGLLGNIAAASPEAAIAHAAVLMGYESADEMEDDYRANTRTPQTITATATDEPAHYTAA